MAPSTAAGSETSSPCAPAASATMAKFMSGARVAPNSSAGPGLAVGIDAERRLLHRGPAGIVEHDGQDRQLVVAATRPGSIAGWRSRRCRRPRSARPCVRAWQASGRAPCRPRSPARRRPGRPACRARCAASAGPPRGPLRIASFSTMSDGFSALASAAQRKCGLIWPTAPGAAAALAACSRRALPSSASRFTRSAARALKPAVGLGLQRGQKVGEDAMAVARQAQVAGEGPHREIALLGIDVDMRPPGGGIVRHVARDPRHVDIDQQADIGLGQRLGRHEAAVAGRIVRQVDVERIELDHPDAGEARQLVEQRDGGMVAAGIGRDQQGPLGRQQLR